MHPDVIYLDLNQVPINDEVVLETLSVPQPMRDPTQADFEATKRHAVVAYRRIVDLWVAERNEADLAKARIHDAQQYLAEREAAMSRIADDATKLSDACAMMGFDLRAEVERLSSEDISDPIPEPSQQEDGTSIKDAVLQILEGHHPQWMTVADIKEVLPLIASTENLHPKTVGMTLYRWSQKACVRRRGRKWQFVPENERQPILDEMKQRSDEAYRVISEALKAGSEVY